VPCTKGIYFLASLTCSTLLLPVQAELYKYDGIENVKLDLIYSKGVVFAKFKSSSCALRAMEDIESRGCQVRLLPYIGIRRRCERGTMIM
jgi:hypothetical protein